MVPSVFTIAFLPRICMRVESVRDIRSHSAPGQWQRRVGERHNELNTGCGPEHRRMFRTEYLSLRERTASNAAKIFSQSQPHESVALPLIASESRVPDSIHRHAGVGGTLLDEETSANP